MSTTRVDMIFLIFCVSSTSMIWTGYTHIGLSAWLDINSYFILFGTCSSPRCPLRSHSLVCIENHLFIVGIGPILNKELELIFRSDRSDVRAFIVRYQCYSINYISINVTKNAVFFGYYNVTHSVRLFNIAT